MLGVINKFKNEIFLTVLVFIFQFLLIEVLHLNPTL